MPSEATDRPELPGYTLTRCLHDGRKSRVFRGTDRDGAPVVVKFLADPFPTERDVARQKRALELGRELGGEFVAAHLRIEPHGRGVALVTEDFGGTSLDQQDVASLPVRAKLRIAVGIARALAHLHAQGVVHKDIKPANIVRHAGTDTLKLIDLGLASRLSAEKTADRTLVAGTLAYLAPEQTGRMNRSVDARSDLYAAGVTLYELLAGAPPFAGATARELVHAHLARDPAPLGAVAPDVPPLLAAIVHRLLEKDPDDRYQSAAGLAWDLARCAEALDAGAIPDFPLGERDLSPVFRFPEALFGRDSERRSLFDAFARARSGRPEAWLVTGPAGIGKSALIREAQTPLADADGWLCEGKFDQYRRDVPYLGWVKAAEELVRQLLTEPEERLAPLRARLAEDLGANASLLTDLAPDLVWLLGEHPAPPDAGPAEAQARFNQAFRSFIRALARPEHPLVLFLDDLQWADLASIKLLEVLRRDRQVGNLLILGAFRDEEVGPGHPLTAALDRLDDVGLALPIHHLGALDDADTTALVAATLHTGAADAAPLAEAVRARTHGNPFFVRQFLETLVKRDCIRFDPDGPAWAWDLAAVEAQGITDNVAALMSQRLDALPEDTLAAVTRAACLGASFDLSSLAGLLDQPRDAVAVSLDPALSEGLVVPLDDAYRLVPTAGADTGLDPRYRFLHDRVQRAAYERLADDERARVHVAIGRTLWHGADVDERLVDIVDHFTAAGQAALDGLDGPSLTDLFLGATRRAKGAMATGPAARYAALGLAVAKQRDLRDAERQLATEAADIAYIEGRFDDVRPYADRALILARGPLDAVAIHNIRIGMGVARNAYVEATHLAVDVLGRDYGIELPKDPGLPRVLQAVAKMRWTLWGTEPASLLELPPMQDPPTVAAMGLLMKTATNAYWGVPNLVPLIAIEMVGQSLQHGNSGLSAYGYALYGMVQAAALGDVSTGYAYGALAMDLLEKTGDRHLLGKTGLLFHGFIRHARDPLRDCAADVLAHLDPAMDAGDVENAAYCGAVAYYADLLAGRSLDGLERRYANTIPAVLESGQEQTAYALRVWLQAVAQLRAERAADSVLSGAHVDFPSVLDELLREGRDMAVAQGVCAAGWLAFVLGDDTRASAAWSHLYTREEAATGQPFLKPCLAMYATVLERKRGAGRLTATERTRLWTLRTRLKVWAGQNPHDFGPLDALRQAEAAWASGQTHLAVARFADAVAMAHERGHTYLEAIGAERAAALHDSLDHPDLARHLLQRSRQLWKHYGALGRLGPTRARLTTSTLSETVSSTEGVALHSLDLDAMLETVRVVSSEIEVDRLAARVAEITLLTAGARRAVLLVDAEGAQKPLAEAVLVDEAVAVRSGEAARSADLPRSLLDYVARTEAPVVVDDAQAHDLFARDPYVRGQGCRSLVAVPLSRQGRLVGTLLLENDRHAGAFTREHADTLEAIAGQAAVSLENARLFEQQRKQSEVFARFVPRQFLEHLDYRRIEDARLGDGVERHMSILFSDLRGFTRLSESMSPDENFAFINAYLARMTPAIERHGGFVDAFVGDAVMALFVADPDGAVRAGIAMQKALEAYNQERAGLGRAELRMGVGVHTGTCRLGIIGSPSRMQANVKGDAVNTASRLEGLTKYYGAALLISEDTRRGLQDPRAFALRPAGPVQVKGKRHAVQVFDVLDARQPAERDALLGTAADFSAALDAYLGRDFATATDGFASCADKVPTDALAERFRDLAARYRIEGVPDDWTGVDVRQVK